METFWQDIRYAARMLVKSPGFTAVAVLTLALGIGANTAIFSVVEGVLLRPMPYDDPGRLAVIWNDYGNAGQSLPAVSPPDFKDYQQRARLMEFAAASPTPGAAITLTDAGGDAHPQRFEMAAVTSNLFPLFGARPVLGRNFTAEEAVVKGPSVAMLSYRLWQRGYNRDPNLVGRAFTSTGKTSQLSESSRRSSAFFSRPKPSSSEIPTCGFPCNWTITRSLGISLSWPSSAGLSLGRRSRRRRPKWTALPISSETKSRSTRNPGCASGWFPCSSMS